ncbi:lipoprotein [Streptomyces sp. NPDC048111]|uniref:lipoprotein n=1 Tax=Streptomyces sp. NPDC048111 TaxID=3365500 RepID=UPI00371F62A7
MRRNVVRGAVAAVLAVAAFAGCGTEKDTGPAAAGSTGTGTSAGPGPSAGSTGPGAAAKAGSVGAPGSACVLPASFDLAAKWKAKPVDAGADDSPLAGLAHQGPFTLACEIDAKPAGSVGFLRAWTGSAASPRAALEAFVGAEKGARKAAYSDVRAGGLPAAEVVYESYSELTEESKQEHALAVVTPKGTLLLHLGGVDTQEHRKMLPAYELAKGSVRVAK